MVNSRMRIVGMLSGIILMALPFGLSGCWETESPKTGASPTASVAPSAEPTPAVSPESEPTPSSMAEAEARVYWLRDTGKKLELTPVKIAVAGDSPPRELKSLLERLLKGPANSDVISSIPAGTKLNSVKVAKDGVHVDLSKSFTSGGGSASMQGRLGQVIYTASSLNPSEPIWINVEGEPLTVLGGEGVEVSQPMTRTDLKKGFSLLSP
jgi:spore germination protein GerM